MAGGGADEVVVGDFLNSVAASENAVFHGPDRSRQDVPPGCGFSVKEGFSGRRDGGHWVRLKG